MLIRYEPAVRGVFIGYMFPISWPDPSTMPFCPTHAHHFHLSMEIIQDLPGRERIDLWGRRVQITPR